MKYKRMPIEVESPEQFGYDLIECNFAESSVADAKMNRFNADISSLVLCYGDHLGHPEFRKMIAADAGVNEDSVLLVPGAAAGLFIVSTSLLERGSRLLVMHPNYATNIETPRAIEAHIDVLKLSFENNFKIDLQSLEQQLRQDTEFVSITNPHNPTGVMMSEDELKSLVKIVCEKHGKYLLVDETYRFMTFVKPPAVAASMHPKVISVSSVSKAFGLPGLRMGWLICQDEKLREKFLAAKEQIIICNSVIDEELAYQAFSRRTQWTAEIKKEVESKFAIVESWMKDHEHLEWVKPEGGVVAFPRISRPGSIDIPRFYSILNQEYKTHVGPGHWFEMPDHYFRIGFGWPDSKQLENGLRYINKALEKSIR